MLSPSKSETDFQVTLRQEEKKQQHQQQQQQQQQQDNSLLLMMGPPVRAPSASAIHSATFQSAADFVGLEKSQSSRSKLRELRERMQTEDEEVLVGGGGVGGGGGVIGGGGGGSPTGSQADSLNEVFQPEGSGDSWRTSHPFRIIEHDALSLHSLTSLGRIRILSNSQETGEPSIDLLLENNTGHPHTFISGGHARDSTISSSLSSSTSTLRSQPEIREEVEPGTGGGGRGGARHSFGAPLETTTSLQEPDVIASTKGNSTGLAVGGESGIPPVAPPRRRKKNRPALLSQSAAPAVRSSPPPTTLAIPTQHDIPKLTKSASVEEKPCPYPIGSGRSGGSTSLPSPASTIESLTREFEHSLDISSATRGQYVVKPQDGGERKGRSTSRGGRNSSTYPPGGGGSVGGGGGSGCPSAPGSGVGGPPPPGGPAQRERRRSAGDEQSLVQAHNQLNMFVRTWTDSGKPLSDLGWIEEDGEDTQGLG
ncbi:hypothetical protein AAG570_002671 [Ranatra chinensis]|uniref:Uncharacterized protein n=1 Tax=Ranatra chinensis TaxID=642074 RepID=A0ABD0Y8B5_9HEMI